MYRHYELLQAHFTRKMSKKAVLHLLGGAALITDGSGPYLISRVGRLTIARIEVQNEPGHSFTFADSC